MSPQSDSSPLFPLHSPRSTINVVDNDDRKMKFSFYESTGDSTFQVPENTRDADVAKDDAIGMEEDNWMASPRSANVHQFYQPSGESSSESGSGIAADLKACVAKAFTSPSNHNILPENKSQADKVEASVQSPPESPPKINRTVRRFDGEPSKAFDINVISPDNRSENMEALLGKVEEEAMKKEELEFNKTTYQFYQPSDVLESSISLCDNFCDHFPLARDVANDEQESEPESEPAKNVHGFYRRPGALERTIVGSFPVESGKSKKVDRMEQSVKSKYQFYQPSETREDNITLESRTSATPLRSGSSPFRDTQASTKHVTCKHKTGITDGEQHKTVPSKNLHQFYQPPKGDANNNSAISLNVSDFATRDSRAAHLTSMNLSTMEHLVRLRMYQESKKMETSLLAKYGFRS